MVKVKDDPVDQRLVRGIGLREGISLNVIEMIGIGPFVTIPLVLSGVLYASAETLRILAILIQPIMPAAAQRLWDQLGLGGAVENRRVPTDVAWGGLKPGTVTSKGEALFPRVDAD